MAEKVREHPGAINGWEKGLTLLELLIVIAILALLMGLLFPVFSQAREKGRQAGCLSNQRNLGAAFLQYSQDYDEGLPIRNPFVTDDATTQNLDQFGFFTSPPEARPPEPDSPVPARRTYWSNAIRPYLRNYQVMHCLSAAAVPVTADYRLVVPFSYQFNALLGAYPMAGVVNPTKCLLAIESYGNRAPISFGSHEPRFTRWLGEYPWRYVPPPNDKTCGTRAVFYWWANPDGQLILPGDMRVHAGGTNYLYADGHTKWQRNPGHWEQSPWRSSEDASGRYWEFWSDATAEGACAPYLFRPIVP